MTRTLSLKSFTCIEMRNLRGSDSPLMPTPVHLECWEQYLESHGYTRVKSAKRFVVLTERNSRNGKWVESLGGQIGEAVCWNCGIDINYEPTKDEIWR
jgi:hypothetical protein